MATSRPPVATSRPQLGPPPAGRLLEDLKKIRGEAKTQRPQWGMGFRAAQSCPPPPPHLQGWGPRGGTGPGAEAREKRERRGSNDAVADALRGYRGPRPFPPPPALGRETQFLEKKKNWEWGGRGI